MSSRGRVIVLNGTSSSGKSTLVRALQARLDGPWLGVGIDTVVFALPKAYLDQPGWARCSATCLPSPVRRAPFRIETGELGLRLVDGLHRMVASLADAGLSVIVDHVLLEPAWLPDLAARLAGHEVLFVGVRCPLDVVVERERARRDRTLGQAAAQFDVVHRAGGYDLEVDTSAAHVGRGGRSDRASDREAGFPPTPFARAIRAAGPSRPPARHATWRRAAGPRRRAARRARSRPVAGVVAALLEDDEPLAQRGDPPPALVVAGRRQREVADRVLAVGVEPERHDDHVARLVGDPRPGHARAPRGTARRTCPAGSGMLRFAPSPSPFPGLVLPAEDVRVLPVRMRVELHVQHVAAAPEDLLGAVAVVVVEVEDRDGPPVRAAIASAAIAALLK